jgi:hypothetical protein
MNKYNKTEEFFLDTTLSIKSTESVKIKESKEYLDFIEIFSTMVKRFIVDFYLKNALFSIVKGTKYDAVYKIPATASKYLVKGFYNNNEGKHFTLGIYEQRGELLTDLIIDDVVIEESLHPIGMVKFLKERGL